jgi:hypothetical protein
MNMPRFFFNLTDGNRTFDDPEGTELSDIASARDEATLSAREILNLRSKPGLPKWSSWRICVVNEEGGQVYCLSISDAKEH